LFEDSNYEAGLATYEFVWELAVYVEAEEEVGI